MMIILDIVLKEAVTELKAAWSKKFDTDFKSLLKDSICLLKNDLSWVTSVSPKQKLCWGILSTCCCMIPTSTEDLKWTFHYSPIINELQLGQIYQTYCTSKKLLYSRELPQEIVLHPSKDLQR